MKKSRGRPRITVDPKRTRSVRLKESERDSILEKYGTVQKWIEEKFKEEFGGGYEAEIEVKSEKGKRLAKKKSDFEASEDDF